MASTWTPGDAFMNVKFHVEHQELPIPPYNEKLHSFTTQYCKSLIGDSDSKVCSFEMWTVLDCMLRNRVRKFGDVSDNIGKCKS